MKVEPKKPAEAPAETILIKANVLGEICEASIEYADELDPLWDVFNLISSQINKAQSGQGPLRERFLQIAAISFAALKKLDREET